MTELMQVYNCNICGNIVEVLHTGQGQLVCCGQPMALAVENTVDASKEKHVPVIEKDGGKVTVKIGSVAHPMDEKHYIEWVEVIADGQTHRQFFSPGSKPEAVFELDASNLVVRAYCNLHGNWKA